MAAGSCLASAQPQHSQQLRKARRGLLTHSLIGQRQDVHGSTGASQGRRSEGKFGAEDAAGLHHAREGQAGRQARDGVLLPLPLLPKWLSVSSSKGTCSKSSSWLTASPTE
jgi:hypothetical protein